METEDHNIYRRLTLSNVCFSLLQSAAKTCSYAIIIIL